MIHDITPRLAYGELVNSQRNSTYGWLRLRSSHTSIVLQLTGNCGPSLTGRHIEFQCRDDAPRSARRLNREKRREKRLRHYQIGPIGYSQLTLRSDDSLAPHGDESFMGTLSLEWFGQDGHVRIDEAPILLKFVRETPLIAELCSDHLTGEDPPPWSGLADLSPLEPVAVGSPQFDSYLNEMCSGSCDTRIADVLQDLFPLPALGTLDDRQVVIQLKSLLANLARHGITLDMCEHFTDRQAYSLLTEILLSQELTYPNLPSVGYVQHLMTHEHCERCAQELDDMLSDL